MKYWLTGIIVILLGLAAWFYLVPREPAVEEAPPTLALPEPAPAAAEEAASIEPPPVPDSAIAEPAVDAGPALPDLADSDPAAIEAATGLVGFEPVERYLSHENVISRAVATVNALSARQIPAVIQVMQGPGGDFAAIPDPEPETVIRNALGDPIPQYTLDPANYDRYTPYVDMLEAADPASISGTYERYEELFEKAFRQLGYPEGGFEQRLLAVIDELLATPQVDGPVRLIKPEAYYRFADERLESLTAGQKILLRMGPDNAARVKARLHLVREALPAGD